MLKKLQSFFPSAIGSTTFPSLENKDLYWFKDEENEPFWLGVPKSEINEIQLELLSTLYEIVIPDHFVNLTESAKKWQAFLFYKDNLPIKENTCIRFIQFKIKNLDQCLNEFEEAIKEFFHNFLAFIWLDENSGVIIEEKSEVAYSEDDLNSISITLENDFYIKAFFYIGKFRNGTSALRESFFLERELFIEAMKHRSKERIFSFEKILPTILSANLPRIARTILSEIIQILKEDPELLQTMEVFLEHNFNASLSAKKLYIHRNTLQYRLDKFMEKTGLNLKNFDHVLTIYLACLVARNPG